ncbi:MAG: zinc-binding dehydrogenase [Actinomycetes bacterium]
MKALVTPGTGRLELVLRDVDEPSPASGQALVAARATSLNPGEVRTIPGAPDGEILGWDVAGTVVEAAADGSGPPVGTRVVGLVSSGAWAQRVAVSTHALATIPDEVSFTDAATLPIAGLTALRALEMGGLLVGRQVLVTGGAGGVGRIAVQLAHLAGAQVTAVVGRPERAAGLHDLGARTIAVGMENATALYDLVLESVGGPSLTHALEHLAPQGVLVTYGRSSFEPAAIDPAWFGSHSGATMIGLLVFTEVEQRRLGTAQLTTLLDLVARGVLDTQVSIDVPWSDATAAAQALMARSVQGKAVLRIE